MRSVGKVSLHQLIPLPAACCGRDRVTEACVRQVKRFITRVVQRCTVATENAVFSGLHDNDDRYEFHILLILFGSYKKSPDM